MKLKASTPLKRIGLILICFYLLSVSTFAIIWNITEKPFLYKTNDWQHWWGYETPPKPKSKSAKGWMRSNGNKAWYETSEECDEKNRKKEFDLSAAKPVDELTLEEKRELSKKTLAEKTDKGKFCPILSEFPDTENYRWENSFDDFFEELIKTWPLLIVGILFFFGIADKIIQWIKTFFIWIKTGHWEQKPKKKKEEGTQNFALSPKLKKVIYGSGVIICWLGTEVLIRSSEIMIGGIAYGLMIFFWLWLFSKVTGINIGFNNKKNL